MAARLPKSMILKSGAEFRAIVQNGHSVRNEYFSIFFVLKDDVQVGFAATRARSKPVRNKLKRIARELWRTNRDQYQLAAHIVIIASVNLLAMTHEKRQTEFNNLLRAIEKRCRNSGMK